MPGLWAFRLLFKNFLNLLIAQNNKNNDKKPTTNLNQSKRGTIKMTKDSATRLHESVKPLLIENLFTKLIVLYLEPTEHTYR